MKAKRKKKKNKPLGKLTPWVWSVEFVRGCNLNCFHCTANLKLNGSKPRFMSFKTWQSLCKVMNEITPHRRLELAQGGEPTLHPDLLAYLKIAKEITPTTQIQVTTNGVNILKGKITFNEILEAGAHSIYVDMYGAEEKYIALAKKAKAEWYMYNQPKISSNENHKMANTYYNDPDMKLIILQNNPEIRLGWRKQGRLSTFLNHTKWEDCMPYGLIPVREPYQRKCTLPMRYSSTDVYGNYLFCCIDFWCESAELLGNVSQGAEGFKEFWFSRLMQTIRRQLRAGDRKNIPYCSRCNCAFSKCDWVRMWPDEAYESCYKDKRWLNLPSVNKDIEVFSDGWGWHKETTNELPSIKEEKKVLSETKKRLIYSDLRKTKVKTLFDES